MYSSIEVDLFKYFMMFFMHEFGGGQRATQKNETKIIVKWWNWEIQNAAQAEAALNGGICFAAMILSGFLKGPWV